MARLLKIHGLVTACVILIVLWFATSTFYYLPKCVLASIVSMPLKNLVNLEEAKELWRVSKLDFAVWLVSFVSTGR